MLRILQSVVSDLHLSVRLFYHVPKVPYGKAAVPISPKLCHFTNTTLYFHFPWLIRVNMIPSSSPSPKPWLEPPSTLEKCLELSSSKGELAQVQSILETWPSTQSPPTPTALSSALNSAVSRGHLAIVRFLLEYGALITRTTPISAARDDQPNSLAIFEAFLEHGWNVQSTQKNGTMNMW